MQMIDPKNVNCDTNRHFRKTKKREYLKGVINELATVLRVGILETCTEA